MDVQTLNLKVNSFITLLSSRRSGKSYLIGDLAYYFLTNPKNKVDVVYMFSNTAHLDETDDTFKWLDKRAILDASIENINQTIINLIHIQTATKKKRRILLIFDDIDLDRQIKGLDILAVRGRHYGITTILSAQIATHVISSPIRNNTTYLFFRRLTSKVIKEQIYSIVQTFETPKELYNYTVNNIHDFQFLFYNNDNDDQNIDIIKAKKRNFIYKLPPPPKKKENKRQRRPGDVFPIL